MVCRRPNRACTTQASPVLTYRPRLTSRDTIYQHKNRYITRRYAPIRPEMCRKENLDKSPVQPNQILYCSFQHSDSRYFAKLSCEGLWQTLGSAFGVLWKTLISRIAIAKNSLRWRNAYVKSVDWPRTRKRTTRENLIAALYLRGKD